jgi:hypothetical protein
VFTRAYGMVSAETAAQRVEDVTDLIHAKTGLPLSHVPFWQVDLHPEALAVMGVPCRPHREASDGASPRAGKCQSLDLLPVAHAHRRRHLRRV